MLTTRYILIANVGQKSINGILKDIEKKSKVKFNMIEANQMKDFNKFPEDFGYIFSIECDDKKYKRILNMNGKEIKSIKPIIISFSENFNIIYEKFNPDSKFFDLIYFLNYESSILDLSNLSAKVSFQTNFNLLSFAQTLYFLIYKFQTVKSRVINEIILDNNNIDYNGFTIFNDLTSVFFPYLQKIFIRKFNFKISEVEFLLDKKYEYFFYHECIYLIARQTDLKIETIEKIIEDHHLKDDNMSSIVSEIKKLETSLKPIDYISNEAYELHQLKSQK